MLDICIHIYHSPYFRLILLLQFLNRCIYIVFSAFYTIIHCFYRNRRCQYNFSFDTAAVLFFSFSLSQQLINLSYRWFIEARHLLAQRFILWLVDWIDCCIVYWLPVFSSSFSFIRFHVSLQTPLRKLCCTYCSGCTLFLCMFCASSIVSWFWSASFYNIKYKSEERTKQDEAGKGRKRKLRKFNTLMERLRALV